MSRKKRVSAEIADEPEEWMLSYADMMSLLLCFFILLYTVGNTDSEKMKVVSTQMKEAFKGVDTEIIPEVQVEKVTETKQARAFQMLVQMLDMGDVDDAMIGTIEKKFKAVKTADVAKERMMKDLGAEASGVVSFLESEGDTKEAVVELVLPENALFLPGEAVIRPEAIGKIKSLAKGLIPIKDILGVEIQGHTDSRPPSGKGIYKDNWQLSSARAASVAAEMIRWGVDRQIVQAVGKADTAPKLPEYDERKKASLSAMAVNRRVEVRVRVKKDKPSSPVSTPIKELKR